MRIFNLRMSHSESIQDFIDPRTKIECAWPVLPPKFVITTMSDSEQDSVQFKWDHNSTLTFLDLYKRYRNTVGSLKIKNFKKMFEVISSELKSLLNREITPSNCENRWKHLERMYKKYVDNNNKTGRGRKDFEYANEMALILGHKKNIHPVLLLSSDTVHVSSNLMEITPGTSTSKEPSPSTETVASESQNKRTPVKRNYKCLKSDLLKQMRKDRQEYYKARLEIEEKKLKVKEKILEEKIRKNLILEKSLNKKN